MTDDPKVEDTPPVVPGDHRARPSGLAPAAVGQIGSFLLAGLVIAALFYDPDTSSRLEPGIWPVVAQFPLLWVGLYASLSFAARSRKESVRALTGFSVHRKDLLYTLAGVMLQYGGGAVYYFLNRDEEAGQSAKDLIANARNNTVGFVVLAFLVGVGAPVIEEMFYRGLVTQGFQRLFRQRFGAPRPRATVGLSVLLSSLWFGAIHLQPLQFPLLFVVGVVCAVLTLRTGRLGPAIFVHVGFNLTTVIALGLDLRSKSEAIWPL